MTKILVSASAVFLIAVSGCNPKKEQTTFVSQSLQEVVAPQTDPVTAKRASTTKTPPQIIRPAAASGTPPIGIVVDRDRIIIDTNQTRHFLESLTLRLDHNFKQIEKGLRREKLRSPNDTGIVITPDRIEVDLNKTQNFVKQWIRSMEAVGQQLNGIARELDKSFNP